MSPKGSIVNQILTNTLDIDTILTLLVRKGVISQTEFDHVRKERLEKIQQAIEISE